MVRSLIRGYFATMIGTAVGLLASMTTVEVPDYRLEQLRRMEESEEFVSIYCNAYQKQTKRVLSLNYIIGGAGSAALAYVLYKIVLSSIDLDFGFMGPL